MSTHPARRTRLRMAAVLFVSLLTLVACATPDREASDPGLSETVAHETVQGIVTRVLVDETVRGPEGREQPYQQLEMRLLSGPREGELVVVEHGQFSGISIQPFREGDRLLLSSYDDTGPDATFYIVDAVRSDVLVILTSVFVVLTVLVGRWRGIASLVSLLLSFAVIFLFVLPRIAGGADPIVTAIAGAAVIIPFTFYLSHGVSRKTSAAVVGTLIALVLTGALAVVSANAALLTGYSSEEATLLQSSTVTQFDMRGVLLASIIIGLLGVLDDITVSQAAIVNQLRGAAPDISNRETVWRAMDVGTDHIASLVNTLVLVYASAAMPLLLLFTLGTAPVFEIVNYEIVAEEIIRALVASIGLIMAVPITTVVAVMGGVSPGPAPAAPDYHDYLAED